MQVDHAVSLYLAALTARGSSAKHLESVSGRLGRFCKKYGDENIETITGEHIQAYFDSLDAAGLAVATLAGHKASLRACWRWLRAEGHTDNQPDAVLSTRRHSYSYTPVQSQPAPVDDFQIVLRRLTEFANHRDGNPRDVRDAALFSVAVDSAKRRGELWHMRRRDVERSLARPEVAAGRHIYRISSRGKTGQVTIVFFEETAVYLAAWLQLMPETAVYVWCNTRTGERLRPESLSLAVVRICQWAGVRPFRLHAIRKRDVTDVIAAAGDAKVGQLLAGHKDPRTTQLHYNQVEQSRVDALAAQLNATRRGPQKGDDLASDFFKNI
jgi:site-specific recombinase XerD